MTSRRWCFTSFLLDTEERLQNGFANGDIIRYVGQRELCPDTTRSHFQGYCVLSKPCRFAGLKKLFGDPGLHCEVPKGSEESNVAYCSKEATRLPGANPVREGDFKTTQGKRTDLEAVRTLLINGANELQIADDNFGVWVRYHRAFNRYRQLLGSPRQHEMVVNVRWGETGTGKTRGVYDEFGVGGVYSLSQPNSERGAIWFDGYTGQKVILIDEFYGWLPISFILKLMDRYPMKVQTKGGFQDLLDTTTHVIITANTSWETWYNWDEYDAELKKAFKRRLSNVQHFITLNKSS